MNKLIKISIFVLIFILGSFTVHSQTTLIKSDNKEWTLENCINYAIKNNIDLKTIDLNIDLAKVNLNQTFYNFLPTLNGNATHEYNWGQRIDPFTNTFATKRVRANNFYLQSSVTLFSGLQNYYLRQQASSDYKIQYYNTEIQIRNLKIEVISNYLQIILNKEIKLTYQEQLKLTKQQEDRVKILVSAGRGTKSDLVEIETQVALDSFNVLKTQADIEISILKLKQLLNLPKEKSFSIVSELVELEIHEELPLLINHLSEIKQLDEQLIRNEKSKQIAKAMLFPTLTLSGSLGSGYSGNNTKLNGKNELIPKPFDVQLNENLYKSVTLTLGIPIFNNNRGKLAIQKAKIETEKTKLTKEKIGIELQNKIYQLIIEIKNGVSQLKSAETSVKLSKVAIENARLKYKKGTINFVTFSEIKTKLFVAKSNFVQSKYQLIFKQKLLSLYEE